MSIHSDAKDLIRSGEKLKADRLLTNHLKHYPNDDNAWLLLAYCVSSHERQISLLTKAISINPKNLKARHNLARLSPGKKSKRRSKSESYRFASTFMFAIAIPMISVASASLFLQPSFLSVMIPNPAPVQQEQYDQPINASLPISENIVEPFFVDENATGHLAAISDETKVLAIPNTPSAYCVPAHSQLELGKIAAVTDSQTLHVEIEGENQVVRYLGIETLAIETHGGEYAFELNQSLEGNSVILASEGPDKNESGELLRYVFLGDHFVNFKLVELGAAVAAEERTGLACDGFFLAAEAIAQEQQVGVWEIIDVRMDPNEWQSWPVVPTISQHAVDIYLTGLANGRISGHFSILGDCQAPQWKLFGLFDYPAFTLNEDSQYLYPTVEQFVGQWSRDGVTVRSGNTVASLNSVYWSNPNLCGGTETPIECELRLNNPSVAFIMLGTNWGNGKDADFDWRLRETVEYLIAQNVLPIIVNKADPANPYVRDFPLNRIMAQIAYDYDIPLWNFWESVQHLNNFGLDPYDTRRIHLGDDAFVVKRWDGLRTLHYLLESVYGE